MAAQIDLVVKKADNVTDITYGALSASGGDGSPAVWRQDLGAPAALPVGLRRIFRMWTLWNGPKTARVAKFSFASPYAVQDTTTTLYQAKDRVVGELTVTVPQGIPASEINEAVYQFLNLCAHAHAKQGVASGYAST